MIERNSHTLQTLELAGKQLLLIITARQLLNLPQATVEQEVHSRRATNLEMLASLTMASFSPKMRRNIDRFDAEIFTRPTTTTQVRDIAITHDPSEAISGGLTLRSVTVQSLENLHQPPEESLYVYEKSLTDLSDVASSTQGEVGAPFELLNPIGDASQLAALQGQFDTAYARYALQSVS